MLYGRIALLVKVINHYNAFKHSANPVYLHPVLVIIMSLLATSGW